MPTSYLSFIQEMYDELMATAEQNKFNAHCWRCQPNAPVCNANSENVSATTTSVVETLTDSEHSLVMMPLKTTAEQDTALQR